MEHFRLIQNLAVAPLAIGMLLMLWMAIAAAAEDTQHRTAGGISAYIGLMPAELVKRPEPRSAEKPMHEKMPRGRHQFHLVVAIFDANTGARVSDATVSASISGLGLSGVQKALEPMKIADTTTYGAFFHLTRDIYTIRLTVQRPGAQPVTLDFKYDHDR
jgi:hypothetical protein